jgi:hypothetical protein
VLAQNLNQPKWLSAGLWINNSHIPQKGILLTIERIKMQQNFKIIMLKEVSQQRIYSA